MSVDPITRLTAALKGRYRTECELAEGRVAAVHLAHDGEVAVAGKDGKAQTIGKNQSVSMGAEGVAKVKTFSIGLEFPERGRTPRSHVARARLRERRNQRASCGGHGSCRDGR